MSKKTKSNYCTDVLVEKETAAWQSSAEHKKKWEEFRVKS
jgi:hypothetical protein